jgi:hypothetical protein
VGKFVDHSLQHNTINKSSGGKSTEQYTVVKDFGNDCVAHKYITEFEEESTPEESNRERQGRLRVAGADNLIV